MAAGKYSKKAGVFLIAVSFSLIVVFSVSAEVFDLSWSTFLSGANYCNLSFSDIAVDSLGCAYISGSTGDSSFPATPGAFRVEFGGQRDGFLIKLNADANNLEYATYLGGKRWDDAAAVAVDSSGCAYVTGVTESTDFPASSSSAGQVMFAEAPVYVIKLNSSGSALCYSKLIQASGWDYSTDIAVDASGGVFLTGFTDSPDFPVTPGSFDTVYNGSGDAFALKLNASGTGIVYSTFIGGLDIEFGQAIAVDSSGCSFIYGQTRSSNFPVTPGSFDPTPNGETDAFVCRINPQGSVLLYSTYVGGSQDERPASAAIAVDSAGSAYVTGDTDSPDFPTTPGSLHETIVKAPGSFAAKIAPSGASLIYSTFLTGGDSLCLAQGIAVDQAGCAYISGRAGEEFATTPGAFSEVYSGNQDVFFLKLNAGATGLCFATYFGGTNWDPAQKVALDSSGNVYLAGRTRSGDFPTTSGAFDEVFSASSEEVFVSKFRLITVFPAAVDIDPDTLNLESNGKWITVCLNPPEGYSVSKIDLASLRLQEIIAPASARIAGGILLLKFSRPELQRMLSPGTKELKLTGRLSDGNRLSASGVVTVLYEAPEKAYRDWSAFLGGDYSRDSAAGIAVDSAGFVYVAGTTGSHYDFPVTSGAFRETYSGKADAFLCKIHPHGSSLVFSSFFGGSGIDSCRALAVDASGAVVIAGDTTSFDLPVTPGSFNEIRDANAGASDVYVAKFDPEGADLEYCGYLGGNSDDNCRSLSLDSAGSVYVGGETRSPDYPVTPGAFDLTYNGTWNSRDFFVTKINPDGTEVVYSTFLGRTGTNGESSLALSADFEGSVYLTGAASPAFPTTPGAFREQASAYNNGFIAKMNPAGTGLDYSTFLVFCAPQDIAVDSAGCAYVTGNTSAVGSDHLPVTSGAFDEHIAPWDTSAFVTKLNPAGSALRYSTFLGESGYDSGNAIAVDSAGSACVTGDTDSDEFPVTADALLNSYQKGYHDAFITKLNPEGGDLVYSTYLGGNDADAGSGIAIGAGGEIFATGNTLSMNFPVTTGSFDIYFNPKGNQLGRADAFVIKLSVPQE